MGTWLLCVMWVLSVIVRFGNSFHDMKARIEFNCSKGPRVFLISSTRPLHFGNNP